MTALESATLSPEQPMDALLQQLLPAVRTKFKELAGRSSQLKGKRLLALAQFAWDQAGVTAAQQLPLALALAAGGAAAPATALPAFEARLVTAVQAHAARTRATALCTSAAAAERAACTSAGAESASAATEAAGLYQQAAGADPCSIEARLGLARLLRSGAISSSDLQQAEVQLLAALQAAEAAGAASAPLPPPEGLAQQRRAARSMLAMLLCQEGRDDEAREHLLALGCRYRLARGVLHYPIDGASSAQAGCNGAAACCSTTDGEAGVGHIGDMSTAEQHATQLPATAADAAATAIASSSTPQCLAAEDATSVPSCSSRGSQQQQYVHAVECALPGPMLSHMQAAFRPASPFWRQHQYDCERSPYFSYGHVLGGQQQSSMDQLIAHVHALVCAWNPAAAEARYAEWWAHCRPHCSGHQLHFDSDNEGLGVVQNPIASTVIFLDADAGGPTLVTNQAFSDTQLASRGWLVGPKVNRLVMFDGSVLHGVLPGRGPASSPGARRVTLMVAFWRELKMRPGDVPGAARPFPGMDAGAAASENSEKPWPASFEPISSAGASLQQEGAAAVREARVVPVDCIWEDVDEEANAAAAASCARGQLQGLPPYDQCFQGF